MLSPAFWVPHSCLPALHTANPDINSQQKRFIEKEEHIENKKQPHSGEQSACSKMFSQKAMLAG